MGFRISRRDGQDEARSPKPGVGLLLAAALLCAVAPPLWAQELQVTSSVDRSRLRLGENLVFTIQIEGPNLAVTQPVLPPVPGFKSVGQYQTLEKTPSGRALAFHYLLSPTDSGRLEVPELSVRVGGQTVVVRGFTAYVETGPSAVAPSPENPPSAAAGDMLLVGNLSADRVFASQPVTYTLHLLTRRSVRGLDVVKPPDFAGFRKVEDPAATQSPTHQVNREGRVFLDAVVIRAILFPLQAGHVRIDPYTAELRLEPDGRGGPLRVSVTGGQAVLDVLPLPPAPTDFKGAVGTFAVSIATPAPARVDLGQPFNLALRIDGAGYLPEEPLLWPATPFFSPYPATTEDRSGFAGATYRTQRVVTLPLLPKLAGDAVLPPARLVFFDPASRSYRTVEAGGAKLVVGGTGSAAQASVNLAPLISEPKPGPRPPDSLTATLFLWLLVGPFLANAFLAAGLWVHRSLLATPEKKRARLLGRQARRALARARRHMDVRRAEGFHEDLTRALTAAMDLRLGRATGGLSRSQLETTLAQAGAGEAQVAELAKLAADLETARYAPDRPTRQDLKRRFDAVARWVKEAGHA